MRDYTEFDLTTPHNPKRLALAQFALAMANLLMAHGIESDTLDDISVNFDGCFKRLDVAQLGADGHLERILLSLAADPNQPHRFGDEIGLPVQPDGQTH
jgi:hypothetical protein